MSNASSAVSMFVTAKNQTTDAEKRALYDGLQYLARAVDDLTRKVETLESDVRSLR